MGEMKLRLSRYRKILTIGAILTFWVLSVFLGTAVECFADLSPVEVATRLQGRYEQTKSISADFRQITSMPMSRRMRRGSGTMVIVKPGLMRWDYNPPEPQVLICDGKTIMMYFANAKQMIVGSALDYLQSDITYGFFSGRGNILKDFDVLSPDVMPDSDADHDGAKTRIIKLVPKKTYPQVDYLHVWVDKQTFMIKRLRIVDQFGSVTDLVFSKIKVNRKFSRDYFKFTPPADTEIIRQ